MEHLLRVINESDRQTLAWLRTHVGDARVAAAARHLASRSDTGNTGNANAPRKPYVSAVCRYLGVWPPAPDTPRLADDDHATGDRYLAQIRELLKRRGGTDLQAG
ncbi:MULTISPECIES: hypothetical protein [Paraburkholderia]|uniref:hypothetical protein n=1 Tax=Paraburkholderia TaxID=1822464 RepID=UPI002256EEE8|nr:MULTISPECIES: hypothetical protein [Paraburkholderia]MCX4162892.1 hypothetical protein [Paraburkholderia megapolitana]MDN7158388.1 hypothetical protein [Paraburkholderia sp. CHISQ3]MDQ6495435.1 hypothetical protein [Paraburkholderia megapolitana]